MAPNLFLYWCCLSSLGSVAASSIVCLLERSAVSKSHPFKVLSVPLTSSRHHEPVFQHVKSSVTETAPRPDLALAIRSGSPTPQAFPTPTGPPARMLRTNPHQEAPRRLPPRKTVQVIPTSPTTQATSKKVFRIRRCRNRRNRRQPSRHRVPSLPDAIRSRCRLDTRRREHSLLPVNSGSLHRRRRRLKPIPPSQRKEISGIVSAAFAVAQRCHIPSDLKKEIVRLLQRSRICVIHGTTWTPDTPCQSCGDASSFRRRKIWASRSFTARFTGTGVYGVPVFHGNLTQDSARWAERRFLFQVGGDVRSLRHSKMSGWLPMPESFSFRCAVWAWFSVRRRRR